MQFWEGVEHLLSLIEDQSPDIIVITGDLVDSRNTDIEIARAFVRAAVKIAPVYSVTGNHETRIPFVGGLVAPNQGFSPKYDAGLYTAETTNMVVSRGIGNSIIPVCIKNRPELVVQLERTQ